MRQDITDFEDPEEVNKIDLNEESVQEELAKFVQEKIELMQSYTQWNSKYCPSDAEVRRACMMYQSVFYALATLHQTARVESEFRDEEYKRAYNRFYVEERTYQKGLGKEGFTNSSDIKIVAETKHEKELADLKAKQILAENKYNFVNHLLENWKDYRFVLGNLTKLAEGEVSAQQVANKTPFYKGDEEDV